MSWFSIAVTYHCELENISLRSVCTRNSSLAISVPADVFTPSGVRPSTVTLTETEMLSFLLNFHHWLHWKLSFWQLSVQPVIKISSQWWHFRFNVTDFKLMLFLSEFRLDPITETLYRRDYFVFKFLWYKFHTRLLPSKRKLCVPK